MRHSDHVNAVSIFGRSISPQQIALFQETGCKNTILVFDGEDAGYSGTVTVAGALAPYCWVRCVQLPEGIKPHHLTWEGLRPHMRNAWTSQK